MPSKTVIQYTALSGVDNDGPPDDDDAQNPPHPKTKTTHSLFLCVVIVLLNLILVGFSIHVDRQLKREIFPDLASLPTPDAYVGLSAVSEHLSTTTDQPTVQSM
ncbi:hypothetical protein C8F04DRAFT_1257173 [Mycena alexandri]|uniref:Uncharacterized protein n=1 Tax=Mycena alexandri TaxID=1745969 RepID=A0AAD6T1V9_9AGAR|nr:hypothetical protein C8F04DRAFT_1257173 [Mycena alexandri]